MRIAMLIGATLLLLTGCDKPPEDQRNREDRWLARVVDDANRNSVECAPPHKCDRNGFPIVSPEAKRKVAKFCPNANPFYVEVYGACPPA